MPSNAAVDIHALVADIEAAVAQRWERGDYPEQLIAALREEFNVDADDQPLEALIHISPHTATTSARRSQLGRAAVIAKRLVRRTVSWYVAPIAHQQTHFNEAVTREVRRLEQRVSRLEVPWSSAPGGGSAARSPRARGIARAFEAAPPGLILVMELDPELTAAVRAQLDSRRQSLRVVTGDPIAVLEGVSARSLSGVVLPGILPLLGARDLIGLLPLVFERLRPGGVVATDFPDREAADRADADVPDPRALRWVEGPTLTLLSEAAGLRDLHLTAVPGGWMTATAHRPSQ